eukprot:TRINITY_DN3933_c0_g1_i1.p1 TRINITY_DN3933_c0_g1~~TRINITY_DN3933_c0_g1_i1.p1  ORF type:complete len:907 (+),score=123.19 TRINITY_DN3933_c0_g1_i1:5504-8224(+)
MRRYAPHHTTVQSWSAPSLNPSSRQRALTHLSSLRTAFRQLFATPHSPLPRPASQAHTSVDDVHAEARLAALHRWLDMRPPLSLPARNALRRLMRPEAVIVRSDQQHTYCRVCYETLSHSRGDEMSPTRSSWILDGDMWQLMAMMLFWVLYVLIALVRWLRRMQTRHQRKLTFRKQKLYLTNKLNTASNYSAWHSAADELDMIEGRAGWKDNAQHSEDNLCETCNQLWSSRAKVRERAAIDRHANDSINSVCDTEMLAGKLRELALLFNQGDVRGLAFALRAGLQRNLAGMCHPEIHAHSRVGTKLIVEDYVNVVSFLIAYIAESEPLQRPTPFPSASASPVVSQPLKEPSNIVDKLVLGRTVFSPHMVTTSEDVSQSSSGAKEKLLSTDEKLTFLNEARHAYGRTALMLSGGAIMGVHHIGVVKALFEQGLLPKVVCGTSAGACAASIVAVFDDDELEEILKYDGLVNPLTGQTFSFKYFDDHVSWMRRIRRFISKGFIQDVKMLQDCLRKTFGDITFEEAYNKTHRILNITLCSSRSYSDPPILLNYLTAPHVLIWSAASASSALPLVFAPVGLFAKDASGRLVPYHADGTRWIDGSITSDIPLARIGELFNVNHFIVSQTNPHIVARGMAIMQTRLALLLKSELQFRYWQALQMGWVPRFMSTIFPHFMQPYAGDVTIMPDVRLFDLRGLLRNPSTETVKDYVRRGEMQTFPFVDRIRLHCLIERTLDKSVEEVATSARGDDADETHARGLRRGLFGRVPSWLWFDTRSILSSGGVSAVANRLGGRKGEEEGEMKTGGCGRGGGAMRLSEKSEAGVEKIEKEATKGVTEKSTKWGKAVEEKGAGKEKRSVDELDQILAEVSREPAEEEEEEELELAETAQLGTVGGTSSGESEESFEPTREMC